MRSWFKHLQILFLSKDKPVVRRIDERSNRLHGIQVEFGDIRQKEMGFEEFGVGSGSDIYIQWNPLGRQ
jgi:putative component of toxin-antitoxin plasmid stabilization module